MSSRPSVRVTLSLAILLAGVSALAAQNVTLPNNPDSVRFAIIGDSGTGSSSQYRIAERLTSVRKAFPYEFVLMLGDNLYGRESEGAFKSKFERPYKAILDAGIKFYAALGNHDEPTQRYYKAFNMNGERFYTFRPKPGVRFFALDSNYVDKPQLDWIEKELKASGSDWKIMFFHHPIYSSGGAHGADLELRIQLEPLFLKYGVDVVFAGHEHFYERIKPQKGIHYFVSGGAAKLRSGDVQKSPQTARSFDTGYHFMILEIDRNALHFQVITDKGGTVDQGTLQKFSDEDKKKLSATMSAPTAARQ